MRWLCSVFCILYSALCILYSSAQAQSEAAITQSLPPVREQSFDPAPYVADIARVEQYLNDLKTLRSRFIQSDPGQGVISNGTLYLLRPGNARWDYVSPGRVSVIITDKSVVYYDHDLDQISYGSIDSPVTDILTRPNIALGKDVLIRNIAKSQENNEMEVTLSDPGTEKDPYITALTLVFQMEPFALKRIRRTTEANEIITVTLLDPRINAELDETLFNFKNPRVYDKKKRN